MPFFHSTLCTAIYTFFVSYIFHQYFFPCATFSTLSQSHLYFLEQIILFTIASTCQGWTWPTILVSLPLTYPWVYSLLSVDLLPFLTLSFTCVSSYSLNIPILAVSICGKGKEVDMRFFSWDIKHLIFRIHFLVVFYWKHVLLVSMRFFNWDLMRQLNSDFNHSVFNFTVHWRTVSHIFFVLALAR